MDDLISRQAAIDVIEAGRLTKLIDAETAVNGLRELPTIQPVATDTNVGDKISRQQAIELIKNYCENGCDIAEDNWCPSCQREQFIKLLKALPTVQPELAIPLSWIDKYTEWLHSLSNVLADQAEAHISVMLEKWRDEQNE